MSTLSYYLNSIFNTQINAQMSPFDIYHVHAHVYSARCNQDEKTGVYLCCFDLHLYQL